MRLLTNKRIGLEGHWLAIVERIPLRPAPTPENYGTWKQSGRSWAPLLSALCRVDSESSGNVG